MQKNLPNLNETNLNRWYNKNTMHVKERLIRMTRICIVEDEEKIRKELSVFLERNGYECVCAESFEDIPSYIRSCKPDLVLLDLNLPGMDGYSICRELRSNSKIPVIIVTSRDTEADELLSMNFGADDFIAKPYNRQILLARIGAVIRRSTPGEASVLSHRGVELNVARSALTYKGNEVELTKNELRILRLLFSTPGVIRSRDEIINDLWQSDEFVDDNTLTVNINRIRRKMEGIGIQNFLLTKRGQGYMI